MHRRCRSTVEHERAVIDYSSARLAGRRAAEPPLQYPHTPRVLRRASTANWVIRAIGAVEYTRLGTAPMQAGELSVLANLSYKRLLVVKRG